jgi:hypothetical protein
VSADREKYLARQRRYNASEKGRARWRRYEHTRYWSDPFYPLLKQQAARRRSLERLERRLA